MMKLKSEDEKRLKEIAAFLSSVKDESSKDQLVGAAKWATIMCNGTTTDNEDQKKGA